MGDTPRGRSHGLRSLARGRLRLLLVPVALAGAVTLATPQVTFAGNGAAEVGVTTYAVNPDKNEIDVTVTYTIRNTTKPKSRHVTCYTYFSCTQTTSYYFNGFYILVDGNAGPVKVTSNAGKVSQASEARAPYSMRGIHLTYPPVWYGQTRVVTATYAIPAGPNSTSPYRALKSYASVCARNNIWTSIDSGAIKVVLPAGFKAAKAGSMTSTTSKDGATTLSTDYTALNYTACVEATNSTNLESSTASAGNTTFTIKSWPDDSAWKTRFTGIVNQNVSKIAELTGLPMGAGPFIITETAGPEVGVAYPSDASPTERVSSGATDTALIEAMARQGYAGTFTQPWMAAGLAGYAAHTIGDGTCSNSGTTVYLNPWRAVAVETSLGDMAYRTSQADTACAMFTQWAKDVGPDRFKAALLAAWRGENPYADAVALDAGAGQPIGPGLLLDMIDERGMVPAGIADLDQAQRPLVGMGVFDDAQLQARSAARARYHALATTAATWELPPVIRNAMAAWDFTAATSAMDAASQILTWRDQSLKAVTGLKLDGSTLQASFESAATQADLEALLPLAKSESEAAAKVGEAAALEASGRNPLQFVGLIASDASGRLDRARASLAALKPSDASSAAQGVIDEINQSTVQGILRLVVILLALLAVVLGLFFRRRRQRLALAAAGVDQANVLAPLAMDGLTPAEPIAPEGAEAAAESGTVESPAAGRSALLLESLRRRFGRLRIPGR